MSERAPDHEDETGGAVRPTLDEVAGEGRPTLDDAGSDERQEASPGEDRPTAELPPDERVTTEVAAEGETLEADTRAMAPAPPRRSRAGLAIVGAILFASLCGPLVFYLGFWRYEPTAQRHVPAGTVLAVRLDVRELLLFAPFREHVLPALSPAPSDPPRPSLLARVRARSGVDVEKDTREIVLATPDAQRWLLLLGGRFLGSSRRGPFVEGYEAAVEEEPGAGDWAREGELLVSPAGIAVAQAEDGTLLGASNADLARAALPATEDYRELWLSSAGGASFSLMRGALLHLASAHRGAVPEAAVLDRAERVTGFVKLGDHESKVTLDVQPEADAPIEPFGADVEALARTLAGQLSAPPTPGAALAEAPALRALLSAFFTRAKVQTRGASVLVTGKIEREEQEAAARELAELLVRARALH